MPNKGSGVSKYPSARLKGIQEFMDFAQEPDWRPSKVDADLLKKLGMAKGKEGLAVSALKFLGLVDDSGALTHEFDELKEHYQPTMNRLVKASYSDLLSLVPPRMVNQMRLVKFFGPPVETAEYQAKLFVWFCGQAGIELPNVEKQFHRARFDKKKKE